MSRGIFILMRGGLYKLCSFARGKLRTYAQYSNSKPLTFTSEETALATPTLFDSHSLKTRKQLDYLDFSF